MEVPLIYSQLEEVKFPPSFKVFTYTRNSNSLSEFACQTLVHQALERTHVRAQQLELIQQHALKSFVRTKKHLFY